MAEEVFNNTGNITLPTRNMPVWAAALLLALSLPVMLLAICGNLLVLVSFIKFRKIMSVYNIFALFLCITDLTVGIIVIPMFIWNELSFSLSNNTDPQQIPGKNEAVCIILFTLFDFVPLYLSELTLFLMATERTVAIFLPGKYLNFKLRHAVVIGISSWSAIILLFIIDVTIDHFNNEDEIHRRCDRSYLSEEVYTFTLVLGIALLILCWILYLAILIRLRRNKQTGIEIKDGRRGNVTKMTVIVLCAFTCCWLPVIVAGFVRISRDINGVQNLGRFIFSALLLLLYSNSAINPFVYNKASEEFRHAFRKILKLEPSTPHETQSSKTENVYYTTST